MKNLDKSISDKMKEIYYKVLIDKIESKKVKLLFSIIYSNWKD